MAGGIVVACGTVFWGCTKQGNPSRFNLAAPGDGCGPDVAGRCAYVFRPFWAPEFMGRFAWVAARVAREGNEADIGQVVRRRYATRMDLGVPIPWAEATRLPSRGRYATGENQPEASRAKIESPARGNDG